MRPEVPSRLPPNFAAPLPVALASQCCSIAKTSRIPTGFPPALGVLACQPHGTTARPAFLWPHASIT